jgi:hypothetical protein
LEDLGLESVVVLHPGAKEFPIADGVRAVPLKSLAGKDASLLGS